MTRKPGREAIGKKGWAAAHKWFLLRRASQLALLGLFVLGPATGLWVVKGTLSSSMTLGVFPLTDPYLLVQSLAAGHWPAGTAWLGAVIVAAVYMLVGGRAYCAWVCPVNVLTDGAGWIERQLGTRKVRQVSPVTRYAFLAGLVCSAALTGTIIWEWINPVTLLHRGLLFGMGLGWITVAGVMVLDVFVVRKGWCGHLCPVGAFYSLLGFFAIPRVSAVRREACTDCSDCYAVCPEPQVISPALKSTEGSRVIGSVNCINCGRCIDVCPQNVFQFTTRFRKHTEVIS